MVAVIGAGMAGLVAAREIARAGFGVVVVEASDRVGGRVWTKPSDGLRIELGAEFIHGKAAELWVLIEEFGLETVERGGAMLEESADDEPDDNESESELFSSLDELADLEPDESFASWLARSGRPAWQYAALTGYVEGFNAADAARISARSLGVQQRAEEAIEGYRAWHVVGGYARLAERLRESLDASDGIVRLGEAAEAVRWSQDPVRRVEIETNAGRIDADAVVVTLPLGVLHRVNKAGGVRIEPEPKAIAQARRMAMGDALHVTLEFRERWWETVPQPRSLAGGSARRMHFLFSRRRTIPVWWTTHPERSPLLVGWAGGPKAVPLTSMPIEDFRALACRELAGIFAVDESFVRQQLVRVWRHDWTGDPLACGAYSYVAAGAIDASEEMCEPEAGTIFFAGEHTDVTGHWGTVHAAVRSGLRAARQVVEALQS